MFKFENTNSTTTATGEQPFGFLGKQLIGFLGHMLVCCSNTGSKLFKLLRALSHPKSQRQNKDNSFPICNTVRDNLAQLVQRRP